MLNNRENMENCIIIFIKKDDNNALINLNKKTFNYFRKIFGRLNNVEKNRYYSFLKNGLDHKTSNEDFEDFKDHIFNVILHSECCDMELVDLRVFKCDYTYIIFID